jgi:hypothetical protein
MMSVDGDGFQDAPSQGFDEPHPDFVRNGLGSNIVLSTNVSLRPHLPSRLLLITGPEVEIPHDDLGIRIRPVEVSAAKLPPSRLTHEFGSMPTETSVKVSEARTFEGLGVLRPLLPQLRLAHDTPKVRLELHGCRLAMRRGSKAAAAGWTARARGHGLTSVDNPAGARPPGRGP